MAKITHFVVENDLLVFFGTWFAAAFLACAMGY